MPLTKRLQDMVHFARWCEREKCEPSSVATLMQFVDLSAKHWADDFAEDKQLEEDIEQLMQDMKLTNVSWPGLYPTFTTPAGNDNVMLPAV